MLLSVIDTDLSDKADLIKGVLDSLKLYINPSIFKEELASRGDYVDEYNKINSEFENQSKIGHATGYTQSSEQVRNYLEKFYSRDSADDNEVVYLSGEKGVDVTQEVKQYRAPSSDPEELG